MSTIQFEHVSKRFSLHRARSRSFQEVFVRSLRLRSSPAREPLWAVRDVSFTVEPGEMLGFIGANGAGKSTILKLITRIIQPTAGKVLVQGRVGALLELGTGFHPDLTGRENIYLNGSFVGLKRKQIDRLMDDIIGFSEIERFIDMPVKHYSSGMYLRLGFSIAIHIEPDILLVDEVLAVGDQAFRQRCLDRVYRLRREGVAIVLVSHGLEEVRELCTRAIWLDNGRIREEGIVDQVIEAYMTQVRADDERSLLRPDSPATGGPGAKARHGAPGEPSSRWGTREVEITRVQLIDGEGHERRTFKTGDQFLVRIEFLAHQPIVRPQFGIALHSRHGLHISGPNTVFCGFDIESIEGPGIIEYHIEQLPLVAGSYLLSATLYNYDGTHAYDHHHQVYAFRVHQDESLQERYGTVIIPGCWRMPGSDGPDSP